MKKGQARQTIRLRLLALVLALVVTWYAMNPAPGPVRRVQRDEVPPDEKRREAKSPPIVDYDFGGAETVVTESAVGAAVEDIEALEWPEVIDII